MKYKRFNTIIAIVTSLIVLFSCAENPIPYDLSDSNLNLDTLTVRSIGGGTYLAPPLMGSTDGIYFGNSGGFNNLFSLVQFSSLSLSGAVRTYSLLDSNVTVDSLVFTFTGTEDTLLTDLPFELFYFPAGGDSVFSESESNYLNITEADVIAAVPIGQGNFVRESPDSTESVYPKLSFKIDDFDDIINFIADTTDTQNRTFMLKNIDPIDDIVSIRTREASDFPIINVYYRVDEDTLHSVFFPLKDMTIVEPRQTTDIDINNISVGRATGLKSIIQFDLSKFPIDTTAMVIKSAELIFNTVTEVSLDGFEVKAAILDTSINISNYWEINKDEYTVKPDVLIFGTFEDNQMKMDIRSYLQGVNTGSYENNGLKLYGDSSCNPFQSANFILDQNNLDNNPYLKIVYVKL